ncbi:MAG: hypothetical protein ACPL0C_05640 [Candidatus Bathyarchaeales archaeon]
MVRIALERLKKWLKGHREGIGESTYYRYAKTCVDPYIDQSRGLQLTVWQVLKPDKYFKVRAEAEEKALELLEKLRELREKRDKCGKKAEVS